MPNPWLALDPSADHFSRPVQRWTCAAAPIHDPATGRLLGAIDVTGGDHLANPHSLALVRATALAAEAYLGGHQEPVGRTAAVTVSGRDKALLSVDESGSASAAGTRSSWCCCCRIRRAVPGISGAGFSLEAPEGVRFMIRSRLLTEDELAELASV